MLARLLAGSPHALSLEGLDAAALGVAATRLLPVVQLPPRGVWGRSGRARWATVERWLGRPLDGGLDVEELALRYLAAFGPATPRDVQVWSGLGRLDEAFERLRPRLRIFRDGRGRELFDLPDAPRPDPDEPAPVRFLGEYDNALLSHDDRSRIVAEEHRPCLMTINGIVPGTLLVDGFVAGQWRIARERRAATLVVEPFAKLAKTERVAAEEEGERLLTFVGGEAAQHEIRFVPPP
jgi:hypothetical protein